MIKAFIGAILVGGPITVLGQRTCHDNVMLETYCETIDCSQRLAQDICPQTCQTCSANQKYIQKTTEMKDGRFVPLSKQCTVKEIIKLACMHGCRKNEKGRGECYCMDGYRSLKQGQICVDVNECIDSPCGVGERCVNLDGFYKCLKVSQAGVSSSQNYYMSDIPCLPSSEPRCGTANRMERIVGGQNTSTKRWPWIVYLTIFRYKLSTSN